MTMQVADVPAVKVILDQATGREAKPLVGFRSYQEPSFWDHSTKTVIEHWSRQIGKSYTYAAWAVDRLLRYPGRLVTVLSNSRDNGSEFMQKVREVCEKLGQAVEIEDNLAELEGNSALSEDVKYAGMRFEARITVGGKTGRIKVLAANPRTARGFSGDLILDEFAFHEDSGAIWEAAEPIISSNPDYLCRIMSTGNGRRNMFYQLISEGRIKYRRIRRSDAWASGDLHIYSQITGEEITPDEARAQSSDKRAYDQNYECAFEDENAALLTQELISAAEREGVAIDRQAWSDASMKRMFQCPDRLEAGLDVARTRDLSVLTVVARSGQLRRVVGMLEMEGMRLPQQQMQLDLVCGLPTFRCVEIDMTGIGLGLTEYAQERWGGSKVRGVNFSTTEPTTRRIQSEGRKAPTAKVTEIMATDLAEVFEDRAIEIPADAGLRDDLRKPEKVVSPGGRVSIAASRDADGHADRFWSLALAVRAGVYSAGPAVYEPVRMATHRGALGAGSRRGGFLLRQIRFAARKTLEGCPSAVRGWLGYSEKFGFPAVLGKTDAAPGTAEFQAMQAAVAAFGNDFGAVVNTGSSLELVERRGGDKTPFEGLIQRADQSMSILWRGADLGTQSHQGAGRGQGASLQSDETDKLDGDRAAWLGESLIGLSRQVIALQFGAGVRPLAYLKIKTEVKRDIQLDIAVDEFLLSNGAPLAVDDAMERYGREQPPEGATLLKAVVPATTAETGAENNTATLERAANDAQGKSAAVSGQLQSATAQQVAAALTKDRAPLRERLEAIAGIEDDDVRHAALVRLRGDLPALLKQINVEPAAGKVLAGAMSAAFFNGVVESETQRAKESPAQ